MTPFVLLLASAAACFIFAGALWFETRRKEQARPRMIVKTGTVRGLESLLVDRRAINVRSQTLVQVDFSVGGKNYCCRDLYLFASNRHVGDVGKKFNVEPGRQVGVYYDPQDPRRSALIIDRPSYSSAIIAAAIGAFLLLIALVPTES